MSPRITRAFLGVLACGAVALPPAAPARAQPQDDSPARYAATAPLAPAADAGGLQRVALPLAVLQASRSAGWADVRVFNAAGEPVPLAWAGMPASAAASTREVPLPRFAWPGPVGEPAAAPAPLTLRLRADGAVLDVQSHAASAPAPAGVQAWLLDLQPLGRERPAALRLDWPATAAGLERRATVQASRDAQSWQPVGSATLVDVPGEAGASAVRQARIELRDLLAEHRYLRLVVSGGAFELRAVLAELSTEAPQAALDSARFKLQPDGERAWRLDAGALLPAQRLQVHLAEDNAVAPLQLQRRPAPAPGRLDADWRPVAPLTAYRLQREGRTLEAPPLALDGGATREWRLVLDERVRPPAAAPEATLWWRAPQLVFAARGAAPFTLAVGRERAADTALPLSTLVPDWKPGAEFRLAEATLGALPPQAAAPAGWLDTLRDAPPAQRRQWLLWGLLTLAVAVLGVLAWRLGRDMKRPDAGPPR
ncbi:DUF3999 family protein [Azohydromonas australica]|uniref:DUF3999 family protein n=1 Tax=Azohydromonas australica TaxID=364039 RepID=UPI00040A4BBB|nr:DUF3999 family protein [Azohydromonas australica]